MSATNANTTGYNITITLSSSYQKLSTLLVSAGFTSFNSSTVFTETVAFRNDDSSITEYIAAGYDAAPTTAIGPLPKQISITYGPGLNSAEVWVKSASGTPTLTVSVGAIAIQSPTIAALASVTVTNNVLSKGSSGDLVDSSITDDGTTVTFAEPLITVTGTTAVANINSPAGVLKTTPAAGDLEFDGASRYSTNDTTSGRGAIPAQNYFRLTSNGSTISTIANYFGATSNISLVASAFYEIDIYAYFLNTTSGTVVWTLTNSAAPTSQNINYEMSPVTGIVAPPGTATMLVGQLVNDATAALALTATGALTTAANHYMHMKIWLQNGTGTSLKIQATKSAGSITPLVGSYYTARRLPAASTGTFAA